MSLPSWLLGLMAKAQKPRADDPSQLVELATVQLFEGPMLAEVLARSAINVHRSETYNAATGLEMVRLDVALGSLEAANRVLADYRNT